MSAKPLQSVSASTASKLRLSSPLAVKPLSQSGGLSLGNLNKSALLKASGSSLKSLAESHLGTHSNDSPKKPPGGELKLKIQSVRKVQSSGFQPMKLDLSKALKPKVAKPAMVLPEPMDIKPTEALKPKLVVQLEVFDEPIEQRLIATTISMLGQILCQPTLVTTQIAKDPMDPFCYAKQIEMTKSLLSSTKHVENRMEITPFRFEEPSPDDIVLEKQKGAFTRTGERKKTTFQS